MTVVSPSGGVGYGGENRLGYGYFDGALLYPPELQYYFFQNLLERTLSEVLCSNTTAPTGKFKKNP